MAASKKYGFIIVKCSECGADRQYTVRTHAEYVRKGIRFLCRRCAKRAYGAHARRRIDGTCSRCGNSYSAQKLSYEHKERHGIPHYCPTCKRQIISEALKIRNRKYWLNRKCRDTTDQPPKPLTELDVFAAPCGWTICNTKQNERHAGACWQCNRTDDGRYERCLEMASARLWDGWAIAKSGVTHYREMQLVEAVAR